MNKYNVTIESKEYNPVKHIFEDKQFSGEFESKSERGVKINEQVKSILWKYDSILGIAYFCPGCKKFLCANETKCTCGQQIDWAKPIEYKGRVKWN